MTSSRLTRIITPKTFFRAQFASTCLTNMFSKPKTSKKFSKKPSRLNKINLILLNNLKISVFTYYVGCVSFKKM